MAVSPAAKIIMVTAVGQKERVVDAVKAGASRYIVKPFQAGKVLAEIGKVLGSA